MAEDKAKKTEQTAKAKTTTRQTKKTAAETVVKEEPKKEVKVAEKTFTKEEVDAMIQKALADAVKSMNQQSQVVQVQASVPMVKLRFQSECSDHNVIQFGLNGKFGSITGKSGTFSVPKEAFGGEFRDELVQNLLRDRELIVLDGLTEEEQELYGVNYKKGEIMDDKLFRKITKMGDEILDIYPDLCETHKIMIARRFMEEFEKNPGAIDRGLILKLNELSKQDYKDCPENDPKRKGAFYPVIEAMNKRDAES